MGCVVIETPLCLTFHGNSDCGPESHSHLFNVLAESL